MPPVRWGRVLLGGLVAGAVIDGCEYLFNGVLLIEQWDRAMRGLHRAVPFGAAEIAAFNLWGFLMGTAAVWLYASICDHYGRGLHTAVYAALGVWVIGYGLGSFPVTAMHLFSSNLVVYGVLLGLAEIVVGTAVGAWLYRPSDMTRPRPHKRNPQAPQGGEVCGSTRRSQS